MKDKVTVVLPTLNEKDNIASLITAIHKELDGLKHEILVVDDNSDDGTYDVVLRLSDPNLKAIKRHENLGLANSIRYGIAFSVSLER